MPKQHENLYMDLNMHILSMESERTGIVAQMYNLHLLTVGPSGQQHPDT